MKKDNIENLYGELKTFAKEPPMELWDNIEARLHPKKKKRRILLFWGSAAAVLIMFLGYIYTNSLEHNSKPIKEITNIEQPKDDDVINESEQKTIKIAEGSDISETNEDTLVEESSIVKESLENLGSQKQSTNRNEILAQKEEDKEWSL